MPGDYAELAKLAGKLKQFADGRAQASLAKAVSNEAVTQVQLSFRESRDPYGHAWAPLKHRNGKPLLLTRRLSASIAVQAVSPTSFRIGTNVRYARYHNEGVDTYFHRKARTVNMAVGKKGRFISRKKASRVVDPFKRLRTAYGDRVVQDIIDKHAEGMSAAKIADHIAETHGKGVSHHTIRKATRASAQSTSFRRLDFKAGTFGMVIPQRQFIPDGNLGPIWAKAFVAAGNTAIARILGSG